MEIIRSLNRSWIVGLFQLIQTYSSGGKVQGGNVRIPILASDVLMLSPSRGDNCTLEPDDDHLRHCHH